MLSPDSFLVATDTEGVSDIDVIKNDDDISGVFDIDAISNECGDAVRSAESASPQIHIFMSNFTSAYLIFKQQ